jgi:sugar lactone lactonase YvrE
MLSGEWFIAAVAVAVLGCTHARSSSADVVGPGPDDIDAVAARGPLALALPAGFELPNGIAVAADGTLFVGSMTSGRIIRLTPGAATWETLFAGSAAVFACGSLRLDERRGLLWGTSPDLEGSRGARVFALDVATGHLRRLLLLPDGGFANDLAVDPGGGIYVTDSKRARVLHLGPDADRFAIVAEDPRFRVEPDQYGPAGIALAADGSLIIGLFSSGRLFRIAPRSGGIEPIALPRALENPDGLALGPDGRLIVLEGAHATGDGKLLAIDIAISGATDPSSIETLAAGLANPGNVSVRDGWIWLTELSPRNGRSHVRALAQPKVLPQ